MSRLIGISVLLVLAAGCRGANETASAPDRPTLQTVSLPDTSNAAEPVQRQIRERYESLQAVLRKTNASATENANAFGDLGKLLVAAEYYDAAATCFLNAQTLAPTDMRWPYYLAHVYRFKNDPGKTTTFFEQALTLSPNHVPTLVWLADTHLGQNETNAAEPLLDEGTIARTRQWCRAVRPWTSRSGETGLRPRREVSRGRSCRWTTGVADSLPSGARVPRSRQSRQGRGASAAARRSRSSTGRSVAGGARHPSAERRRLRDAGVEGDGGASVGRRGGEPPEGDRDRAR